MSGKRLAIDVGGTFMDFVLLDASSGEVTSEKELSLAHEISEHVFAGINRLEISPADLEMIVHGSTVVINTILQELGDTVGLITTQGFRDALELGRGSRPEVYNLLYKPPKPLVPRYLREEVPERLNHEGEVVLSLDEAATRSAIERLRDHGVSGIAVCFLHSYANPAHERRVREIIREVYPEAEVSISSDITGEFREFERTSTVVLNTYVMPRMRAYIGDLDAHLSDWGFRGALNMIQSTGGMTSYNEAQDMPIRTLESGPAGGVIGAATLGMEIGQPNLIAADVGGTSFDVALIDGGQPFEKSQTIVNQRPVLQPTIDIVSIGAGGGSIAWLDEAGGFRVGPHSAEADPGPVCFGRGGTEPTVTDAHLILGRLNPDFFLGQRMRLDLLGAEHAIRNKIASPLGLSLQEAAYGITRLADTNMVNAIRQVTIERGHDPRDFTLLCYGGGGGLFAASLAAELQIRAAIIPTHPSVFSAWGILNSEYREDTVRTFVMPLSDLSVDQLVQIFEDLVALGTAQLAKSGLTTDSVRHRREVDMRYEGQEHTVRVPVPSDEELKERGLTVLQEQFDILHEQAYAHASPGTPSELVNLRLATSVEASKPRILKIASGSGNGSAGLKGARDVFFKESDGVVECPIYAREKLGAGDRFEGPAIVEEWSSTVVVNPGQRLRVDEYGNLLIN